MEDIVIVGFGGHAKSVADCIKRSKNYNIVGYTDAAERNSEYVYLGTDDELESLYYSGVRNAVICIGYLGKGSTRQIIYEKLKAIGYNLPIIIDPSAIISDTVQIEEGTFVGKGVIVNSDARIGKMVILNTNSIVEHECYVGDFSHVAVSAVLCGQVRLGNAVFVGANATIIQNVKIEDNSMIPAGRVIIKDVLGRQENEDKD